MIIDTDTANEIDDQYALAWALLSPERLTLEGVTAVPFSFAHHRDKLIKSVELLQRGKTAVGGGRTLHGRSGGLGQAAWWHRAEAAGTSRFVGPDEGDGTVLSAKSSAFSTSVMSTPGAASCAALPATWPTSAAPIDSPAAQFIVERARANGERPLYMLAMGALTNIASALLMAPDIIENIVVVWTSGFPSYAPFSNEPSLNLVQDRLAS